jgi:hypothetical protein
LGFGRTVGFCTVGFCIVPIDERHNLAAETVPAASPPQAGVVGSWAEQDEVLRNLWLAGEAPPQIAEKLGRSVAAIMTRAARLGLPRRFAPGRKPTTRRTFLPTQQRLPLQRRPETAKPAETTPAKPLVDRICLMCLTKFPSQGAHNRICASCKDSNDYSAGSRLPDLDFPT